MPRILVLIVFLVGAVTVVTWLWHKFSIVRFHNPAYRFWHWHLNRRVKGVK